MALAGIDPDAPVDPLAAVDLTREPSGEPGSGEALLRAKAIQRRLIEEARSRRN